MTLRSRRGGARGARRRGGARLARGNASEPVARGDQGSVTAELVVALPAVVLVLAACVGALQVAAAQVRLQDAAALGARAAARGDDPAVAARSAPGARIDVWREGELRCASASGTASWAPGLPSLTLVARSCALAEG